VYISEDKSPITVIQRLDIKTLKMTKVMELPMDFAEVALDPIGQNLYWAKREEGKLGLICVTSIINPNITMRILTDDFNTFVLDYKSGYIYLSHWHEGPKRMIIKRAWMDGSHMESLGWAGDHLQTGIAVSEKAIYWSDYGVGNIVKFDVEKNVKKNISNNNPSFSIDGFIIVGNDFFGIDRHLRNIIRVTQNSGNSTIIFSDNSTLVGLAFYNSSTDVLSNFCENGGNCSQICLTTPKGGKCACRQGYKVNGTDCVADVRARCDEGEYRCKNGRCVAAAMKCDGFDDCEDGGSDEWYCQDVLCSASTFKCNDSNCIPKTWVCIRWVT